MKKISAITVLLVILSASVCFAAPILTKPAVTNIGANIATINLQSNGTGTGYFTLRTGTDANCGTGSNVAFGPYSSGSYHGSLPLTANVPGKYTISNLLQNAPYTVCFTADSPSGSNLNETPAQENLTTTESIALTSPGWNPSGGAGFSGSPAHFTSLAFAPDGTPYVASVNANDSYKISVMSYYGNNWNLAGTAGFAAGSANPVSLAFAPDGALYLSFVDATYTTQVMKFNSIANSWTTLGTGLPADTDSTSLAFAPDGTPLVAYIDGGDSSAQIMTYSGGVWASTAVSTAPATTPSLAIAPDGTPYLGYADNGIGGRATVMKFTGTGWIPVGSSGFSLGTAINTSLAIAPDGSLYLAYQDVAASGKATVMKFTDSAWDPVGIAGFSSGTATDISLAIAPDGNPSVAFKDGASTKATVMKYTGSAWGFVGSAGFSAAAANSTALAFAPDGSPHVAYSDVGSGSRATLMQLTDIRPTISGDPPATATVGVSYYFHPVTSFATGFTIENKPLWADFDPISGVMSGTPTAVGTYPGIIITATNSVGSTSLPAFSIVVSETSATGNVRIESSLYLTINAALAAASSGNHILEILATINPEGVNYSGSGIITLAGGYYGNWSRDQDIFSPVSSLIITGGTLIIDQITVSGP